MSRPQTLIMAMIALALVAIALLLAVIALQPRDALPTPMPTATQISIDVPILCPENWTSPCPANMTATAAFATERAAVRLPDPTETPSGD